MIVSEQGLISLTSLTNATTGFTVQLSASSSTTVISTAGADPPRTVVVAGFDAVGSVVSSTVIVCVTIALFPQASVYVHVRVIVPPHAPPVRAPSAPVTVPAPSQLSVQPRSIIAGTSAIHSTVKAAGGAENTGT